MPEKESVGGIQMEAELDTSKFDKGIDSVKGKLDQLDPALKKTEDSTKKVEQATNAAGLSFGKLVKAIGLANIATSLYFKGLNLAIAGLEQLTTKPIKNAIAFESVMAKVGTTLRGSTKKDIDALGDAILQMTTKFPKSKDELGLGLYDILQSGVEDSASAMMLLETATKAAVGGTTDVGSSAKVLTQIMNAYNLTSEETTELMDAIFVGAQKGSAEFADLATSLGTTLGTASQLNVEIPKVVAAVETMSVAGFSADEATTSINAFFTSIIQANDPMTESAKTAKALGLEYNSAALKSKGLQQFIQDMTDKVGNNESAMLSLTGNVRAFRAVASIAGKGNEFFNETLEEMEERTGALDEAFNRIAGTVQSKMTLAWNKWDAALTDAGRKNTPQLTKAVDELNASLDENKDAIAEAAGELSGTFVDGMTAIVDMAPELIHDLDLIAKAIALVVKPIIWLLEAKTWAENAADSTGQKLRQAAGKGYLGVNLGMMARTMDREDAANAPSINSSTGLPKLPNSKTKFGTESDPSGFTGAGGGGQSQKKAIDEIAKAEKDVIAALGEQAKANLDNLNIRKKELEIRKDLGILSTRETEELRRINRLVIFNEDNVDKATAAWKKQQGVVESLKEDIKSINDDIEQTTKDLQKRLGEIDNDTKKRKTDKVADLIKEQNDIRSQLNGGDALTGDQSRRLGEIQEQLRNVDPTLIDAGTKQAGMNDFEIFDRDAQEEKAKATLDANEKLTVSKQQLAEKTQELNREESTLKITYDAVVTSLETMRTSNETNFTAIETRTKDHVARQIEQLNKLTAAYGGVYGPGGGAAAAQQAASEISGVAKYADGGVIRGPGSDRSDNLLALVSPRERIISAETNRMYNPILEMIHNRTFPLPRFADGGLVNSNNNNSRSATIHNHYHGANGRRMGSDDMMAYYVRRAMR